MTTSQNEPQVAKNAQFLILFTGAVLLAIYVLLRYAGLWGETDTNSFTSAIRSMLDGGRLVSQGHVYPNGYGFQTLAVFL
ncbi:MAG: hypothetical protein ACPGWR_32915, partial [Ardenticatenaceae bacterium]